MSRVSLSALAVLLLCGSGCATCTMAPDGTVTGKAFGNAACSVCPPTLALPRGGADGVVEPAPIPSPIVPVVHKDCLIVQGGAETGSSILSGLGLLGAFLAGLAL